MPSSTAYCANSQPDAALLQALAEKYPDNPFCTPAFVRSKVERGAVPVLFAAVGFADEPGFLAFYRKGRIHRDLDVVSAPDIDESHPLWEAVREYCRARHITRLEIHTFGSSGAVMPSIGRAQACHTRHEFVLKLGPDVPPLPASSNHRRNVRRAEQAGLQLSNRVDEAARAAHLVLVSLSMDRIHDRGDASARGVSQKEVESLVGSGAGTLFQAISPGQEILSSILVLLAARGAYYHSAGTSPEGMASGASHFLISAVAADLRDRGLTTFNLGGTIPSQSGLARFKQGFGATSVPLEAANFATATGAWAVLVALADRVQRVLNWWQQHLGGWI
jgi:hypothetical protein